MLSPYSAGAYWHENFVQHNRELSLCISRIKAPKRRSAGQNTAKSMEKQAAPASRAQQPPVFGLNTSERMVFPQAMHCQIGQQSLMGNVSPDELSSTSSTSSDSRKSQPLSDVSVAETYQWLSNVGLPVSAFDPVALSEKFSVRASATELLECADEITSLFATPATSPTKETRLAPISATLEAPMPLSTFPASQDITLPVSPSLAATSSEQQHQLSVPDDLLFDTALPTIENDNWALW